MLTIQNQGCMLNVKVDGPESGHPIILANSLGTDLRVWDLMIAHLPETYKFIRYDKRGHGLSDCPAAPYDMKILVDDAAVVADTLGVSNATFIGLSIGGLIGQGLAASRPDLISKLVLMDTAAKIGTKSLWDDRIATLQIGGWDEMADTVMERWFTSEFLDDSFRLSTWRNMLMRTPIEGYVGCCHAIAGADFRETSANLEMPVLAIVGADDKATTPTMVQDTASLIGATFQVIQGAGHLPCVEKPREVATAILEFLGDAPND